MLGFESIISGGLTVVTYTLVLLSVYRIFQMATDLSEMKQLLKDIRRNTGSAESRAVAVTPVPTSAEALVRAVHAASYEDLDEAIAEPPNHA